MGRRQLGVSVVTEAVDYSDDDESGTTQGDDEKNSLLASTGADSNHTCKRIIVLKYLLALLVVFLVGCLNQVWWRQGRVSSEDKQQKPPSSLDQMDQHDKDDKPILFVHFHKSGGSTACQIMTTNKSRGKTITTGNMTKDQVNRYYSSMYASHKGRGRAWGGFAKNYAKQRGPQRQLRSQRVYFGKRNKAIVEKVRNETMHNCNIPPVGPLFDVQVYGASQTCGHVLDYTMQHGTRMFYAIEIPLEDSLPCHNEQFRTMAIMRRPVSRVLSHLKFQKVRLDVAKQWMAHKKPNPPQNYMVGYPILNNMVIRQLLGRDRYNNTVDPIGQVDYNRAKRIVDEFDVFVPLEYLSHPNVQQLLQEWVPEYRKRYEQHGGSDFVVNKATKKSRAKEPSHEFVQQLVQENVYDQMLYDYMLAKLGINETRG